MSREATLLPSPSLAITPEPPKPHRSSGHPTPTANAAEIPLESLVGHRGDIESRARSDQLRHPEVCAKEINLSTQASGLRLFQPSL